MRGYGDYCQLSFSYVKELEMYFYTIKNSKVLSLPQKELQKCQLG